MTNLFGIQFLLSDHIQFLNWQLEGIKAQDTKLGGNECKLYYVAGADAFFKALKF